MDSLKVWYVRVKQGIWTRRVEIHDTLPLTNASTSPGRSVPGTEGSPMVRPGTGGRLGSPRVSAH